MPEYEVVQATKKKDVPAKEPGKKDNQVINLRLQVGDEQRLAEWFTTVDTPLPMPQSKIEGDLKDDPQWGWKFFPTKGRGGYGGRGGRDPQESRRIVRQHSQKCAVELLKVAHDLGLVKPNREGETPMERVSELATMVVSISHFLEGDVYRED